MQDAHSIVNALHGRWCGSYGVARCPAHADREPSLSIRDGEREIIVNCFAGCYWRDVKDHLRRQGLLDGAGTPPTPTPVTPAHSPDQGQLLKGRRLWDCRQTVEGSPVERYFRRRGYRGDAPATIGFLPPGAYAFPAMIAAFGLADELEPSVLSIREEEVRGAHLTLLRLNGEGKADTTPAKIMLGASTGWPIVVAPPNDGLGIAICEGIEDALSVHQATGLGTWAAGSAGRMPALAAKVPDYIPVVTIYCDDDEAGRRGTYGLADALVARGIEVLVEGAS
jgi:hypothetical protein